MSEDWSPAVQALNRQCEYYISEIERVTAEREQARTQVARLRTACLEATMQIHAMIGDLKHVCLWNEWREKECTEVLRLLREADGLGRS